MSETLTCRDGIHWHPVSVISKYSIDQTAWAERQNARLLSQGNFDGVRRPPATRAEARRVGTSYLQPSQLHGSWLAAQFPGGPEDGVAHDEGNLLVSAGLSQIINLLIGTAQSGVIRTMSNGQTVVGVGTTTTAAAITDTALGSDNTANAYYQGSDALFPSVTAPNTINNQCTFASGVANYVWGEWCWATGQTIAAGTHLATGGVFTTLAGMVNHKIPVGTLGTKASGASWVFSTTIVFS